MEEKCELAGCEDALRLFPLQTRAVPNIPLTTKTRSDLISNSAGA